MADISLFDNTFILDNAADVSIDVSASHSYSNTSGSHPWRLSIYVDGVLNNTRQGSGAVSDVISIMGACGQLASGSHNVKIIWYGDSVITLSGSVLRILITKR